MLIISIIVAGQFTEASTVSDSGRFMTGPLSAVSESGAATMAGDSCGLGMRGDSNPAQADAARHAGETGKEFAIRSASFLIGKENYLAALKILFAARIAWPSDTIDILLARCFEKTGSIDLALGANYAAGDSCGPLWPLVLFQRASLLYAIGMDQRAGETARLVIARFRKSTYADSCRRLLDSRERNALVPVLSVRSYAAYGLRNYHYATTSPDVLPGIVSPADTTVTSGNGFIRPGLSWTVLKSGPFQCNLEPTLELQFPYYVPRREQYGYGAEINCNDILEYSSFKYGLAARRALYYRTGPINTYTAYGVFIDSWGGKRSLMLLASGAAQRSPSVLLNGSCINVVAQERSALTMGDRIAFHPGITALRTGFRDVDNRFVPWAVAVSGVSEKSDVHQATYYQDTTFAAVLPVDGFKANSGEVLLPFARPVQAFKAGSYSPSTYYSLGFTNTIEVKIRTPFSLSLHTSYTASWYPHAFLWDNASEVPSGSDALGLIFYNRDDGRYYYTESLASGEFHRYRRWEKTRIDQNFACGMGAEYTVRRLGTFMAQATMSINRSSIPSNALFDFNYVEMTPRFDWIVQW